MRGVLRAYWIACCCALAASLPVAAQGDGALVVVVSAANTETPDPDDVALMFKRRKLFWDSGKRVQPVNLPPDNPLRQHFSRHVLRMSPEAQEEFWNEQYFHGVLPPHVLASAAAMRRFVADTATAIGYLSACDLDASVRPVLEVAGDGRIRRIGRIEDTPVCH